MISVVVIDVLAKPVVECRLNPNRIVDHRWTSHDLLRVERLSDSHAGWLGLNSRGLADCLRLDC